MSRSFPGSTRVVRWGASAWVFENVGSSSTLLNGEPVTRVAVDRPLDLVLGSAGGPVLRIEPAAQAAAPPTGLSWGRSRRRRPAPPRGTARCRAPAPPAAPELAPLGPAAAGRPQPGRLPARLGELGGRRPAARARPRPG